VIGQFGYCYLEPRLDSSHDLLVAIRRNKRNCKALGTEASSTTNTVKVAVSVGWTVVIDYDVYTLNINAATKNISGNEDTLLKRLEGCVSVDSFFLLQARMDADTGEIT